MQNVQFVFLASLPSLPLCFQPRSRPFVARAWMRKDYGLFCSLKDRSTDRQTWRTLKRIAIVVRKLVSLTIFQRSFLLIDTMLQRHILFDLSYSSNFSSYKPRSQVPPLSFFLGADEQERTLGTRLVWPINIQTWHRGSLEENKSKEIILRLSNE